MPVTTTICCGQFGIPAQKSILHVCHFQGACVFIAHEYQVAFELYHMTILPDGFIAI